jgi:hypothetical protein
MTEAEWHTGINSKPMLEFLRGKTSDRKLRLFSCIEFMRSSRPTVQAIIEIIERVADDGIENVESCSFFIPPSAWQAAWEAYGGFAIGQRKRKSRIVGFIRCIFGNPFRPITVNPSWLTSTVLAVARQMYESRDFSAMPILADALQDTGCDNEDMLNHCRQPGGHVRGCFVVDLLLAKG